MQVYSLSQNAQFAENCAVIGYTLVAAFTDVLFQEFKGILAQEFKMDPDLQILPIKQRLYEQLLPQNDGAVLYM